MRSQEQCSMGMSDLCSLWPAGRAFRSQLQVLFSFLDESIVFNDFRIFLADSLLSLFVMLLTWRGIGPTYSKIGWLHPNSLIWRCPIHGCTLKSSILFSDFPWNKLSSYGSTPMDWNPPFVLRILMMGQDRFTRLLVHVNDLKMQLWSWKRGLVFGLNRADP